MAPSNRTAEVLRVKRAANAALAPYVHGSTGWADADTGPRRRRHAPGLRLPVIFVLGGELETEGSGQAAGPAFVAGLHDTCAVTLERGATWGVQVDFTPAGAYRLLGAPLGDLAKQTLDLGEAFGADGRALAEAVADARDWEARFDRVERFVFARMERGAAPPADVMGALSSLRRSGGRMSVGRLAVEAGWSRKHLAARFREHLGLPPKTIARIIRFQRVLRAIEQGEERSWPAIAAGCGYFDQAHLIRDFNRFAGGSPGDFLRRRLPQGGVSGD